MGFTKPNFRNIYNLNFVYQKRGTVVEWLERLGYSAERRRQVVRSRLGFVMRRLENCFCQSIRKWVPFSNQGRIKRGKMRDGLRFSFVVPKIYWDSRPIGPYASMANLDLYLYQKIKITIDYIYKKIFMDSHFLYFFYI